jgi:hypothetical protein
LYNKYRPDDRSREIVEWQMNGLLDYLEETYMEDSDSSLVDNLLGYSKGFWKGLFTD